MATIVECIRIARMGKMIDEQPRKIRFNTKKEAEAWIDLIKMVDREATYTNFNIRMA